MCWNLEFSPYSPLGARSVDTFLNWIDQTKHAMPHPFVSSPEPAERTGTLIPVNSVAQVKSPAKNLEQLVMDKLDRLENDLANTKASFGALDKSQKLRDKEPMQKSGSAGHNANNKETKLKCYNCHRYGHAARDCRKTCRYGSKEHITMDCPLEEDFRRGSLPQ